MTITSTVTKVTAMGNGSTTAFDFDFLIPASGDESVIITDASGNQTVLNPTQYVVTGFNNSAGGSVQYPLSGSPLASGASITIARILPLTQEVSISNQSPFAPQAVEGALDNTVMQIQQLAEEQNRVISAPIVDPATINLVLPAAAQRAGQLVGFDGSGNVIAAQPSSALVSSAMQPVVAAGTTAAARTLLGIGALAEEGIGAGLQDDGSGLLRVNFATLTIASNTTITAADHLKQIIVASAANLALPKASTLWSGFGFLVFAVGGNCVLTPNASDTIQTGGSGAGFTIVQGGQAWVVTDGVSAWRVLYVPPLNLASTAIILGKDPTVQRFTSGSGTYTPTSGTVRIRVRMIGGGGGGGAASTNNGTAGGTSSFGSWTAIGGAAGLAGGPAGGAGGTGGNNGTGTLITRLAGGSGGGAQITTPTLSGCGGNSALGGAAGPVAGTTPGNAAAANTGSGGSGGCIAGGSAGSGGGAGEYVEFYVSSPTATAFAVGGGGAGGAAGISEAGGNGASAQIVVEEFFN